jgi:hypothetical protein
MEQSVKRSLIAAILPVALCWCSPAIGQQLDYMPEVNDMSTVAIGPTSPLGIDSSSSVGGTGISLGATEIRSAGLSPLATYSNGTIALPGTGTACATSGGSSSGLIGSTDTYDGGGMAMGSATTATSGTAQMAGVPAPSAVSIDPGALPTGGMSTTSAMGTVGVSGMCSSESGSPATSPSTPMSTTPTTPGGNPRTGLPLGSWEITNLGVSPFATIPTPGASPFVSTVGPAMTTPTTVPLTPVITAPTPTTTTNTVTAPGQINVSGSSINVSGIPALIPGLVSRR